MESRLLDVACARIAELTLPAFIKDSQLRYVAVNDSYARFFGRPASAFPGRVSADFSDADDDGTREDRERRTLVFGTEESTFVSEPGGGRRHVLDVERFISEDDRFYVFGVVEWRGAGRPGLLPGDIGRSDPSANERGRSPGAGVPADLDPQQFADPHVAGKAFDLAEVGIGLFDSNGIFIYQNETQKRFYECVFGDAVSIGDDVHTLLGHLWDTGIIAGSEAGIGRDEWIRQRIAAHQGQDHEHVDLLPNGCYIRLISRRLDDGGFLVFTNDVSESKRQEELLREQVRATEIYRSALEGLPVAVFLRDTDGRLTYANAAYETLLGNDRSLFIGKTEKEMFPGAWERFRKENRSVVETGEAIEKSEDVVFASDSSLSVITRLNRIAAPDGERFVVGSITDVSVLKAREVQLLEARSHAEKLRSDLETILQSLPVGVMILDGNFDIESVNAAFADVWTAGDPLALIGRPYREFVRANYDSNSYAGIGEDFEAVYRSRIESFSKADAEPLEVRSHDGKVLIIGNKALSNGKYLLTYFDITAVREREREAHEAKEALERLGELWGDATRVMSQGLLIMHEGRIVMSNGALPDMLHVPPAMLEPGQPWSRLLTFLCERGDLGGPDDVAGLRQMFAERIPRGESLSASFLADGKTWVLFESNLSSRDHWIAVFTDVTELKRRQEELTLLLERAEAADRAKSEFLANMSHEIRTPMNGVLGMAELLAKSNLDTRQKTFTDIIVKSGNALLTIINDILDFSKIDAGQMKLRSMPFDPVEAIEDVASLLSTAAARKDIELAVRGTQALRQVVVGDAGRFRQIVTNLLGNAIKFTEKGHVLIDFGFAPMQDGRQMLTLRIADTGIGIPEDKLDSIFEKFSQADASNTRRHEGTGLGLSITAGLVELFGGEIAVESVPGEGSVFTVRLPLPVAGGQRDPSPLPVNVQGAHVLVIDDNAVSRAVLMEQLSGWGFDAYACASGGEAFSIMDAALDSGLAIDAVIVDFPMEKDDAANIARRMRDSAQHADVPVIFLTSMEVAGSEHLFAALNVQAHLMKPPRVDLLRKTVVDVVRGARLRRGMLKEDETASAVSLPPAAPAPAVAAAVSFSPKRSGLDILVAEDNEVNQIVFTQILQATGLSFRIARNGQEAVEIWRTDTPSMVLMDVSMPVMNGHQATRLIRRIEEEEGLQRVPIIGVTAHALDRDRDLCLESGMDDYLSKPISPELLEAKISRWLGIRGQDAGGRDARS
ncbi:PAS-domain containing protein [Rhizobiaceae bacterium BDR2-2]|uniref:histidine kinase n=1 Tax=Ectorhizobium quercum TaxID=2965071 RepID=A0AAE3MZP2_9HYPH|nr:PAS-domain containing protein [Ectorhizobium quercum]MCX8996660.1 PAS-domain containing protein [Ectorhizobium quercum]